MLFFISSLRREAVKDTAVLCIIRVLISPINIFLSSSPLTIKLLRRNSNFARFLITTVLTPIITLFEYAQSSRKAIDELMQN